MFSVLFPDGSSRDKIFEGCGGFIYKKVLTAHLKTLRRAIDRAIDDPHTVDPRRDRNIDDDRDTSTRAIHCFAESHEGRIIIEVNF